MDERKKYWDEQYMDYWRSRVNEAGVGKSNIIKEDSCTEDISIYKNIFDEYGLNKGNILDVGCAWGRMFNLFHKFDLDISGVDISTSMIKEAEKEWRGVDSIKTLKEAAAESLPFDDQFFDNLVCLAVFDATFQEQAITEFLRVTKPGAKIYLTGKNSNYFSSDAEAFAAEKGAREKGHPNYFTHTDNLLEQLTKQGHKIIGHYFFPKRGDFALFNHHSDISSPFYEYLLIVERGDSYEKLPIISDKYSSTFKAINK